jgi:uncharacterized membrane protein YbaN (DUF454 family)
MHPRYTEESERVAGNSPLRRGLLIVAGIFFLILAVLGIVVPLLPTTPFLLLAGACFVRSSEKLHRWLYSNRLFGQYLQRYRDGEGMPLVSKITTLFLLWVTLGVSAFVAVPDGFWWIWVVLLAVGIGVTVHLVRIKTYRR